jgi:hypothetical protein
MNCFVSIPNPTDIKSQEPATTQDDGLCMERDYNFWNYCKNDRDWQGRPFAECCVIVYLDVKSGLNKCELTGVRHGYHNGCTGYMDHWVEKMNVFETKVLGAKMKRSCDPRLGHYCNAPALFNCPITVNTIALEKIKVQEELEEAARVIENIVLEKISSAGVGGSGEGNRKHCVRKDIFSRSWRKRRG